MNFLDRGLRLAKALAALALTYHAISCSNVGKSDSPSAAVTVAVDPGADAVKLSRIVITPKGQWKDLRGYVVGNPEHATLSTLADVNKPGFLNMTDGVYDIVLEGQLLGIDGKSSPAALRISGVKIAKGYDTQIREVDLKPYLKIDGKILLNGESTHAGISVGILGTPLSAVTAVDGSFSIANVPAGTHSFEFTFAGFNSGFINARDYRADEQLPNIALTRESLRLESGIYYIGPSVTANSGQIIALQLAAPGTMTHFRYGTASDLNESPWIALQSSFETELPAGDAPEIFVQYSVAERQLSQVFSVKIPLDN